MKRNFTKLWLTGLLTATIISSTSAQTDSLKNTIQGKNLVNLSLTSLILNNYSISYERAVAKKISVGLGVRYMPKGKIPLLNRFESLIDDEDTFNQLKDFRMGNVAITPEVKFYFGKGVFRGFYIAPFARYAKYTAEFPNFEFETSGSTETIALDGDLKTFTGGVLFGAQWKLSNLVYLNWSILGPQYGTSKGLLSGTSSKPFTKEEQDELRKELEDLEIPFAETTTTVNAQGARMDIKGPWAGARASVGLSFRF